MTTERFVKQALVVGLDEVIHSRGNIVDIMSWGTRSTEISLELHFRASTDVSVRYAFTLRSRPDVRHEICSESLELARTGEGVVFANREYEAWFLAAAESLQGHRGLPNDLAAPADPESIRGAKQWLEQRMPKNDRYAPTKHQASFSRRMSLDEARRAPSFEKLCRDVQRLVEALRMAEG